MRSHRRVILLLALVALPTAVALAKKAPIDVHGKSWQFDMKVGLKVQKVGGFKAFDQALLYIGPNGGMGLADNEFLLHSQTIGEDYTGTWSDPKANGKLVLNINVADIEDFLTNQIEDILNSEFADVRNVTVTVNKLKTKVKLDPIKNKASVSFKASFVGIADIEGEHQEGKGAYSVKGKGGLLPP